MSPVVELGVADCAACPEVWTLSVDEPLHVSCVVPTVFGSEADETALGARLLEAARPT